MAAGDLNYVWLLPLLESPREAVESDLQAAIDALQLPSPLHANYVALREIVSTALSLRASGYWANLAANWIESGFPLDSGLIDQIDAAVQMKAWDQSTRHRLYRAARHSSPPPKPPAGL